jgi:1,4-dihydroxy-2-naphthoate polyprenyltransferase
MDALQTRLRDKASEMLQNTPTITVATGCGPTFTIETYYMVGTSDELHCIVKPLPALVEAVRNDARVAFAVTREFPKQMVQGTGRAFFLGGLDQHPQVREQTLTKIPDATAFLTTIRNLGVLQILPDQLSITDDSNLGLGPRPVYVPEAARALPDRRHRWLQAIRPTSWLLILIPILIAALLASRAFAEIMWWLLLPICLVALLIQTGITLLATHTGFSRNIEYSEALGFTRLLHEGLLSTRPVWLTGIVCVAMGSLLGLLMVGIRGWPLLLIGIIGMAGGLLYAGWPVYPSSRVIEDAAVFVGLGPLVVLGTYYALTGTVSALPVLVSLLFGCLAESILHARHLYRFSARVDGKIRTLAVMLGWKRARMFFYALVSLPYVLLALLILTGDLPGWAWLSFLSLPLTGRSVLSVWRASSEQAHGLADLDRQMTQTHLTFSALLLLGLLVG